MRVSAPARATNELHDSSFPRFTVLPCTSRVPLSPIGRLCIAASFKSQSSVPRTAYPFVPNHSTAAAASIRGHATSSPALKAATRNSDGKSRGNNSEGIVSSPTRTLSLCGAELQSCQKMCGIDPKSNSAILHQFLVASALDPLVRTLTRHLGL